MTDTVTVTAPVTYRAWKAPNFATLDMPPGLKQDGLKELPSIPVADLPAVAMDALAQQWLDHLYGKIGRANPFKLTEG